MKIKRAIKTAAVAKQIREAVGIAHEADIHGVEIQEIFPIISEISFEKRAKIILEGLGDYRMNNLVYHHPLRAAYDSVEQAGSELDLSFGQGDHYFHLAEETIKEAGYVGRKLKLPGALINFHLIGFAKPEEITEREMKKKLEVGEKRLVEIKKMADHYSEKYACKLTLTRENNPPDHDIALGVLDFDPRDTIRTLKQGVYANLDFAHFWECVRYKENGKGEFPGVDLNISLHPNLGISETIRMIAPGLRLIHINDAGPGYDKNFEGLEIGKGTMPHKEFIESIMASAKNDIVGTYEIKNGHIDPETMLRSDKRYREIFGSKFFEYFD